jgi:RNA polymerase sigma-70 factor (ECF subfamily)
LTASDLKTKTERAIHGDRAAFEEICAAKRRELSFAAMSMLGSKEDAEDAVQDAMISMYRNIGKLKNPEAFNAWAYKILHARCKNIIRGKVRRVRTTPLSEEMVNTIADRDIDGEPEKILGERELSAELRDAIETLPEKSREALVLYYFGDMKYREIAKATGSSVKTVSTNLIRAKRNLETLLKERYPEMASLPELPSAPLSRPLARTAGGGMAAFGLKLKAGLFLGKEMLAASSGFTIPAAAGTAAAICAAAITYTTLAPPQYEIALAGDCDCGHINPHSIELKETRAGDRVGEWELLTREGETLSAGSLDSVTDYIRGLEKARRNGYYTLRCVVTSVNGGRYAVSRDITIGNFDRDA